MPEKIGERVRKSEGQREQWTWAVYNRPSDAEVLKLKFEATHKSYTPGEVLLDLGGVTNFTDMGGGMKCGIESSGAPHCVVNKNGHTYMASGARQHSTDSVAEFLREAVSAVS